MTGNQKLTVDKILDGRRVEDREPVIRTDFDQARKRLMATGAFQSVAYEFKPSADAKGVDGTLHVVEVDAGFRIISRICPLAMPICAPCCASRS